MMRYRVYRIGGNETERLEDRPVLGAVYDDTAAPTEQELDGLYERYGESNMLPVIEDDDSELPVTVRDVLGSPAERVCPKHGKHIGAACPHCALDEMVEISEKLGLYDNNH